MNDEIACMGRDSRGQPPACPGAIVLGSRRRGATIAAMPELVYETLLDAPLAEVWAWHMNPRQAFAALAPPDGDVRIEQLDEPMADGSRLCFSARGLLGRRIAWVARHEDVRPPHPVAFGEEARFVDVQERGPFAAWRHEHDFEHAGLKQTRLIDRVVYRLPLHPISTPLDWLVVRPKLRRMFAHRRAVLAARFGVAK
jgi:ligand-binding SRPBCC domain-containing protein